MVTVQRLFQEPPIQWLTAAPLWAQLDDDTSREAFRRPALLRFTRDSFMEDFLSIAAASPQRLGEWQAPRETWRKPAPVPPLVQPAGPALPPPADVIDAELAAQPLKLYQPAHERFYLVTANLVCRLPGLPDKMLNFSRAEQVTFVLRRDMRVPPGQQVREHAQVDGRWQPIEPGQEAQLVPGETRYPMFPVTYLEFGRRQRRLLAGLVPVSQREALLTAGRQPAEPPPDSPETAAERRVAQLLTVLNIDVLAPWDSIKQLWQREDANIVTSWGKVENNTERLALRNTVNLARNKLQTASWYVLLDLAYFLRDRLPAVWAHIWANPNGSVPAGAPGQALIEALQDATFEPETSNAYTAPDAPGVLRDKLRGRNTSGGNSMALALRDAYAARNHLETATAEYVPGAGGWPATTFLLCGRRVIALLDDLSALVGDALAESPPEPGRRIPLTPAAPDISGNTDASDYGHDLFTIRCVFERPNCPPGVRPAVVSQPSVPFQMASYFDPDAPARPIRIPMPVDTSPAGLRKFAKNTMFVMSDTLACQVEKAKGITLGDLVLSVLPWPFHKDLPDPGVAGCEGGASTFGMLCTLSIPIITICALILLIIIVFVLDIIFKWVPYLIFCLPLPGLKAKGSSS